MCYNDIEESRTSIGELNMKTIAIVSAITFALLSVGCTENPTKGVNSNYQAALNGVEKMNQAKTALATTLAQSCATASSQEVAMCVAFVATQFGNGGGTGTTQIPAPPQEVPSFASQLALHVLDGVFDVAKIGVPTFYQYKTAQANDSTQLGIAQSNNNMLSTIVTSGYNASATIGSRPTVQVGGNYTSGNGNTVGDNNTNGNNNGQGDRYYHNGVITQGNDNRSSSPGPFDNSGNCTTGNGGATDTGGTSGSSGNCQPTTP
jgi:hypothetical protein